MKSMLIFLFLLFPFTAMAQNQTANGIDPANIMQLMQQVQQCMAQVDQSEMAKFKEGIEKFEVELDTLCSQGKRKQAQKKAIAFGKQSLKNPAILQMKKCGEITKGLLPQEAGPSFDDTFDFSEGHVCDE